MFSQLRHHLSLLKPEEGLPLKKYEYVAHSHFKLAQLQNKTPSIKCKATIFNAACVDAVFDVDSNCRIKDLKEMYSLEASNPYSDMLYAIDPEKDERPEPIGDGFAPAAVLTLVDEEGRQLEDEELLFPEYSGELSELSPGCCLEFTAQVFIAAFEIDMPKLSEHLSVGCCADAQDAWKCVKIIRAIMFGEVGHVSENSAKEYLGLRDYATEREIRRTVEKMLFHISSEAFRRVLSLLGGLLGLGLGATAQTIAVRLDFLTTALSAGVNRFGINDMKKLFDEYLAYVDANIHRIRLVNVSLLKPIMEALLKSKRVSEEDIVNHVFKKHLRAFCWRDGDGRGGYQDDMIKEYMEVMKGRITAEDFEIAQRLFGKVSLLTVWRIPHNQQRTFKSSES